MSRRSRQRTRTDYPIEGTDRLIDRELSWLAFNSRVLEEAWNPDNPLLERLKFLAISALNLDEFTMVRYAGLKEQERLGIEADEGLSAGEQLVRLRNASSRLMRDQQASWLAIHDELARENIVIGGVDQLNYAERDWLREYFLSNIFPALTPIAIDPAHPFPFLPNLSLAVMFELERKSTGKRQISVLPLPPKLPRFIKVAGDRSEGKTRYVLLEEVVGLFLDTLLPGFTLISWGFFRVVRDSDLDIEEEAEDLIVSYEKAIKERRRGRVIRVKALSSGNPALLKRFTDHLGAAEDDITIVPGFVGMASLFDLYGLLDRPDLKYPAYSPRFPERIGDYDGDCFAAIQAKDIVVHHPFESFDVVVQFLRQAARDPDVVTIKQTLYRTSKDSPIVRALIEAAEQGKSVTALVELKARFDEEANMKWARDLERAGVQVVYGFVNLKTHCKVSLVIRREGGRLQPYAHFGTGNYHPATAKVYTDLSFFTCDEALCQDATYLFNHITGYGEPEHFLKLVEAPSHLRPKTLELIARETAFAKEGKPAAIWAKMNALADRKVIEALYEASNAGVQIDLVVRGICRLRPGVPGMSENIRVKSIVGRFLEHSRIYCYGDGHAMPSRKTRVYLASADWMPRNFDHRVEVMVPVENETVHAQILDQIMVANLRDDLKSWRLLPDGTYERLRVSGIGFSAHEYFMTNPSLSGRGKALKREAKARKAAIGALTRPPEKTR